MISPWRTGVAFGVVVGLIHLGWAGLVAAGVAEPILNFILGLHFIDLQIHIAPFRMGTAVTLVALTAALGAVAGAIFAGAWNWLHGQARS